MHSSFICYNLCGEIQPKQIQKTIHHRGTEYTEVFMCKTHISVYAPGIVTFYDKN